MAGGGDNSWRHVRPRVELARLPVRVDLSASRGQLLVQLVAGLVWIGASSYFALKQVPRIGPAGADQYVQYAFLLFPLIGVFIVGGAIWRMLCRRHAVIDRGAVSVEGRTPFGREQWSLPLAAFAGVRHRTGVIRRKNSSTTYQIIDLAHNDPAKSILLWVERGVAVPRQRWEGYARMLGVPALGADSEARAPEDLDKALRDLADEGKVEVAYDPAVPVPPGLELNRVKHDGADQLSVTIRAPRFPRWAVALFVLPVLGVGAAGLAQGRLLALVVAVGGIALLVWLYRHDRRNPRRLILTRDAITYDDRWGTVSQSGSGLTLPVDRVEQVYITKSGREVVIAGDAGRIKTGTGLSRDAVKWLKNYLAAAILHA